MQDRDPEQRQADLLGPAQLQGRRDLQRLEIEVGLVEAVEQHEPVGAGSRPGWRAISPSALKKGLSFIATGMRTAAFTARSTWR